MLIIHAHLHTMAGADIADGYLRTEGNQIAELGGMPVEPKPGEEVIDAQGAGLYPGFVDAHTHLGMWEDGLTFEGDDGNEETDPVTPQLRAIDAINPVDRCFQEALHAGVTTVVTGPGSANAIGGANGCGQDLWKLHRPHDCQSAVCHQNGAGRKPKKCLPRKEPGPFDSDVHCGADPRTALQGQALPGGAGAGGKGRGFRHAGIRHEMRGLAPCAPEGNSSAFSRSPRRRHFHSGAHCKGVPARLCGRAWDGGAFDCRRACGTGTRVLSGPFLCDRSKPELRNQTPSTPGILSGAGVPTAIITDHPVIPIQYLPVCAGLAVREGMDYEEALRAITINPAKICGLDHRLGSLEVGKDADLVLFDQDPLTIAAKPKMVIAGGKLV